MSSTNIIQNSTTYKLADEINEICKPLFDAFNLNYFVYAKIYSNNSLSILLNDKCWYQHYFENKYPIMGTSRTDGVYSWDKFMPDEAIADGGNYFNHHQGIVIFKKHQDFIEQLEFASADKNYPAIELCLNKFHLLEKFVFYFKDKAAKLIAKSDKEHLIIPDSMQNKALEEKTYSEFCNLIKTNKIHLNFKSKAIILTKREYEVLLQFAQGKTVKEAAKVLNISPRTVESHLKNAKDKSNCLFKSQIIDILRNSLLSSVRLINSENIG